MTGDEKRTISRIAHSLRAGAGGNPVARAAAHDLIELVGGEHEHASPSNLKDDRPLPGVFDLRRQLGRAPTVAEFRATRDR